MKFRPQPADDHPDTSCPREPTRSFLLGFSRRKGPSMNDLTARSPLHAGTALAVAALLILLCAPAQAGRTGHRHARPQPAATAQATAVARPATPTVPPAVALSAAPAGAAGMVVAIDPETGALVVPTAEQMRALVAAGPARPLTAAERTGLMRTSEGLTEVRMSDGSVKLDLQGRFMEYSVLQLDPMGCPHFLCVNDETVLRALMARYAPASTPACEEK
jgi:hypothetical protein